MSKDDYALLERALFAFSGLLFASVILVECAANPRAPAADQTVDSAMIEEISIDDPRSPVIDRGRVYIKIEAINGE